MNIQTGMYLENRYEILCKIGEGGMSDVYKARCHKLNRFVAIKFLKPEFCEDKNFVRNFQNEAQSAAALLHPNVVSVYDVIHSDGLYYIVMEYVDGITLKKYIERNGRLPVKEATSIAIQIAQGIDAAHNANIIHRDIKPQNVLISREGKIKVTDFGIARTTTANTISTDILGSVQYISPEQARGGQVDARTDIYSFGIVYYEMVTGRLPFDGDSTVAIALKHIQENVPRAGDVVDGVPNSVSRIIEKCTQRKPDRRYQKTSSLLSDLKTSLITPNEDFVVLEPEPSESATIIMSGQDAEILRREGSKALTKSSQRSASKPLPDRNPRRYQEQSRRYDERERYSYNDRYEDSRYDTRPGPVKRPVQKKKKKNRSEKILLFCGTTAIVIIIVLLGVVCLRTFSKGGCAGGKTVVQTETQSVTDTARSVPSVVGKDVSKAQNELEDLGFVVKIIYSHSDSMAKEYVMEQSVQSGTVLEPGHEITLTVSAGQDQILVPEYKGQDQNSVITALNRMGLRATSREEFSDDVEEKTVIRTEPAAGEMVDPNSLVTLIVSKGPENVLVTVPDVTWYTVSGAIELLNAYSLPSYTTYEESDSMAGYVISQWPAAGAEVEEWTWVNLVVGIEPEEQEDYDWIEYQSEDVFYPDDMDGNDDDNGTEYNIEDVSDNDNEPDDEEGNDQTGDDDEGTDGGGNNTTMFGPGADVSGETASIPEIQISGSLNTEN